MPVSQPTFKPSADVNVSGATTHNIYNKVSPGVANSEFSQTITDGTKQLLIKCRGSAKLQITFVSGETATKYITVHKGTVYSAKDLDLQSFTLYMEADKASQTVEIEEWY